MNGALESVRSDDIILWISLCFQVNITEPEKPDTMTEAEHHYRHHMTVGRVAGLLALSIADATVLQLDIVAAAKRLQSDVLAVNQDIVSFSEMTAGKAVSTSMG